MSDYKEIIKKLQEPFSINEIEFRVQSQGKSAVGNNIWCQVLAYVDARALQNRLDEVFTPFGWEDKYEPVGDDFICTLTVEWDGKKVSKQNGASKTQVEGFKGGISNSFKRVCASGFGIGRYLYDLDVMFTETSLEKQTGKDWKRGVFKDKATNKYITYYWKIPKLPNEALPSVSTITQEQAMELKELSKLKNQKLDMITKRFKIQRLGELSTEAFKQIIDEWSKL